MGKASGLWVVIGLMLLAAGPRIQAAERSISH